MSKIQVGGYAPERGIGQDGCIKDIDGRVLRVHAQGYRPRMPSDGQCGCKRASCPSEGYLTVHLIDLCETHGREPGIVKFCLKPPRRTLDPGLTP